MKSGRAVLLPVLKGQYQRHSATFPAGPNAVRDLFVLQSKDFRRSVDYLVSRPDVDGNRLGLFALSFGAGAVPTLAVGENRLKAAVLVHAGLSLGWDLLPEADSLNFVSRFRVPVLLIGGRSDFVIPLEASQLPMFRLLGAPEKDKRMLLWEGGHGEIKPNYRMVVKEALAWFDLYLGPVKQ